MRGAAEDWLIPAVDSWSLRSERDDKSGQISKVTGQDVVAKARCQQDEVGVYNI